MGVQREREREGERNIHSLFHLFMHSLVDSFLNCFYLLILERERGMGDREREKHLSTVPTVCIHWFLLVCTLTRDQTCNLDISGPCSNPLGYPARAGQGIFDLFYSSYTPSA